MNLQDTPETYLFKIWPWIEANKTRLIWVGSIIVVAVAVISFRTHWRTQREIDAGVALTQLMITEPRNNTAEQQADLFLQLAGQYPGTAAAQRALLQGATILFEGRKYTDAQTRFQQFLGEYTDSQLAPQAALGLAACLDAGGKPDSAAAAYQRVINSYSDPIASTFAKFRLAQIDEQLGKRSEALDLYEDVARSSRGSTLGSEAGLRATELRMQAPASQNPAVPGAVLKPNR